MDITGKIKNSLFFPVLLSAICFSACASLPGPLYSWGNYENQIYAYLQGESPVAQIGALQNDLLKIEEKGKKPPPGYYAHLGMLYSEVGEHGQAVSCFIVEKTRFPESAVFMDYLLARQTPETGESAADPNAVFSGGRPRSILVMPPVNQSPDIMAPTAFLATSTWPLAESGYYVIPVSLSNRMFRENGVTVAEDAHAIAPSKLREIFGADSALYITITRYGVRYVGIASVVEAAASARLIDLRNGLELWSGRVALSESSNNNSSRRGNFLEIVISAALDQIANVLSDKAYDVGKAANHQMLSAGRKNGILYGPYHYKYGTDFVSR